MKRVKRLGLAVGVALALSWVLAGVASAEVSILPTGTPANPVQFTVSGGATRVETLSGKQVRCTSAEGVGEVTSERLGHFKIAFKGCEEPTLKVKCSDLSHTDAEAIVTLEGEFHLRTGLAGQPLGIVAFLISPDVHFLCSIILFLKLGCLAAEATRLNELVTSGSGSLKETAGENQISSIDNNAESGMESCVVQFKQGSGAEETGGVEGTLELANPKQGGSSVTALIHA